MPVNCSLRKRNYDMKNFTKSSKIIFLLLFNLFYFNYTFCQNKKFSYLNDKGNIISLSSYKTKINSNLFYTILEINHDTIIKGMRLKESYGQLDLKQKQQLNKLFNKRFGIDSTKTWLIHYIDSLPNVNKMPKISGLYLFNEFENKIEEEIKSKKFYHFAEDSLLVSYKTYINYSKKILLSYNDYKKIVFLENKKYSKFSSVQLIHFFNLNNGYPEEDINNDKLYPDKGLIVKKLFNKSIYDNYHIIIIHPNGKYYKVYSREIFKIKERKLLKYKSFLRLEKNGIKPLKILTKPSV